MSTKDRLVVLEKRLNVLECEEMAKNIAVLLSRHEQGGMAFSIDELEHFVSELGKLPQNQRQLMDALCGGMATFLGLVRETYPQKKIFH